MGGGAPHTQHIAPILSQHMHWFGLPSSEGREKEKEKEKEKVKEREKEREGKGRREEKGK